MIKIYWLRNEERQPVACIAAGERDGVIAYGVATHNPIDSFSKVLGRRIATGRMILNGHTTEVGIGATYRIMRDVAHIDSVHPLRTKAAANLWLSTHIQQEEILCSTQERSTTTS